MDAGWKRLEQLMSYDVDTVVLIGRRAFKRLSPALGSRTWVELCQGKETNDRYFTASLPAFEAEEGEDHKVVTPVVSINNKNVDHYMWGRNCQVLGYQVEQSQDILCGSGWTPTQEQCDLFWEGYMDPTIVKAPWVAQ